MADNTTLNPGAAGDVIRDIQRADLAKRQVVALDLGGVSGNAENLIDAGQAFMANAVPVVQAWDTPAASMEIQLVDLLRTLIWSSGAAPAIWSPFQELAQKFDASLSAIIGRQNQASSTKPIMGGFAATGSSFAFIPAYGRPFNVSIWGTFVATVQIERTFDNGTNWLPLTAGGTQMFIYQAPASEVTQEDEVGVVYRLRCTAYTSGTASYRISQ